LRDRRGQAGVANPQRVAGSDHQRLCAPPPAKHVRAGERFNIVSLVQGCCQRGVVLGHQAEKERVRRAAQVARQLSRRVARELKHEGGEHWVEG